MLNGTMTEVYVREFLVAKTTTSSFCKVPKNDVRPRGKVDVGRGGIAIMNDDATSGSRKTLWPSG